MMYALNMNVYIAGVSTDGFFLSIYIKEAKKMNKMKNNNNSNKQE